MVNGRLGGVWRKFVPPSSTGVTPILNESPKMRVTIPMRRYLKVFR